MNVENLADYVTRQIKERNLSTFDVWRRSNKAISQSSVSRIQNGEIRNPGAGKLKALAKGLGVPEWELFSIARGVSPNKTLVNERLAAIDTLYPGVPKQHRLKLDYLLELAEREARRLCDIAASGVELAPTAPTTIVTPQITTEPKRKSQVP